MKTTNVFNSTYHRQTNRQAEQYSKTLAAMLCCYVYGHQQKWDAYDSTLTYVYNGRVCQSTNTRPFELVPNQRISEIGIRINIVFEKTFTVTKQLNRCLSTLEHSMNCSSASSQRTQEHYHGILTEEFTRVKNVEWLERKCLLMYWIKFLKHQSWNVQS